MQADLIIIGAGPAGMAAAARAAQAGLSVLLLDEQPRAGGQIYRNVERVPPTLGAILGTDYTDGLCLTEALHHPAITHLTGATVWQIDDNDAPGVTFTQNGTATQATGQRILLATGALERPMPLPGWTLPGVMTAGAAQILLKQSGMVAGRAVLAGSGPLLYLVAAQMVRAGTPPLALVETQTRADFAKALRHLPGALGGWRYLLKGQQMLSELRRAGVPRHTGATGIAVEGACHAEGLRFTSGGKTHRIACDTVLLHHGVVPNTQAARSVGVPHRWDPRQRCFSPDCDIWGRTALQHIFIAGDSAGIGGATVAARAGALATLAIAHDLGALSSAARDAAARPLRAALRTDLAIRPFLDRAFPPCAGALSPADSTLICRCEEVTAGQIRRFAGLGCLGPNQAKAFGRAGMGPCQGRFCGLSVTEILSEANARTPQETGYQRIRPPLAPVTLAEIASLADTPPVPASSTDPTPHETAP